MAVEGDLRDVNLASLIQVICQRQRVAEVVVERSGERGEIYFAQGEIVHAIAGSQAGEEAVHSLLAWEEGRFRVEEGVEAPARSVHASWHRLLLDGLKQVEESESRRAREQPVPPPPPAAGDDGELEDRLIALLSSLEQLRVRLADRKVRRKPLQALDLYLEVVNQAADVSREVQSEAGGWTLETLLGQACQKFPQARLLKVDEADRLSVEGIKQTYQPSANGTGLGRDLLIGACAAMSAMLEGCLAEILDGFRADELKRHWSETCATFVLELKATVENVEF